ncbi:MAG: hypothetical protein ABEJ71_04235 [Halodesulfurarchaeum sp.]
MSDRRRRGLPRTFLVVLGSSLLVVGGVISAIGVVNRDGALTVAGFALLFPGMLLSIYGALLFRVDIIIPKGILAVLGGKLLFVGSAVLLLGVETADQVSQIGGMAFLANGVVIGSYSAYLYWEGEGSSTARGAG